MKEFLLRPEGILVTDIESFNGAQAKNIIMILDGNNAYSGKVIINMIMRTTSFVIIIHNNNIFNQSVPGLVRDNDLHEFISCGNTEQSF